MIKSVKADLTAPERTTAISTAANAQAASALKRLLDRGAPYGTCRDHQTLRLQR